jgi:uroporphyrin-III C-methyltransferase
MGLQGLKEGKVVVRLKQGDPYIYGRGAEEYAFFRSHGYDITVLPGITSALSAPLFAAIPPTHRAVADQVLICTGTGRKGAAPEPPVYNPSQTVVFLMSLHRLSSLITSLARSPSVSSAPGKDGEDAERKRWPRDTPCAVIERASCPDQRVIRSTLADIEVAVEEEGSRPPGLLVVGWSCQVLYEGKQRWVVEDGFRGLDDLAGGAEPPSLGVLGVVEDSRGSHAAR